MLPIGDTVTSYSTAAIHASLGEFDISYISSKPRSYAEFENRLGLLTLILVIGSENYIGTTLGGLRAIACTPLLSTLSLYFAHGVLAILGWFFSGARAIGFPSLHALGNMVRPDTVTRPDWP